MKERRKTLATNRIVPPNEYLEVRYQLQRQALKDLKKGKVRSARMLAGHDQLGPKLSVRDIARRLKYQDPDNSNDGTFKEQNER